nr:hypothetical protein [uncultured Methanobrevibacter sp.]
MNRLFFSWVFVFDSILSAPPWVALLAMNWLFVNVASQVICAAPPALVAVFSSNMLFSNCEFSDWSILRAPAYFPLLFEK